MYHFIDLSLGYSNENDNFKKCTYLHVLHFVKTNKCFNITHQP